MATNNSEADDRIEIVQASSFKPRLSLFPINFREPGEAATNLQVHERSHHERRKIARQIGRAV
jgi:hypothetical protein